MIYVLEVSDKSSFKIVGFQGQEYFAYENDTDIDVFYEELTDHYSINELSELNLHTHIIDCNAPRQSVLKLFHKISDCKRMNLNNVEDVIQVHTLKEIDLDSDAVCVNFLGEKYTYTYSNGYYSGSDRNDIDNQKELSLEDFISFLFCSRFNCAALNKELEEKENIIKKRNAILIKRNIEISELKKEILQLKHWE